MKARLLLYRWHPENEKPAIIAGFFAFTEMLYLTFYISLCSFYSLF